MAFIMIIFDYFYRHLTHEARVKEMEEEHMTQIEPMERLVLK